MKINVIGKTLHVHISKEEISQMIKDELFIANQPMEGVAIICDSAEVNIKLNDWDVDDSEKPCQCWIPSDGGRCQGTREIDPVSCDGNKSKCKFG